MEWGWATRGNRGRSRGGDCGGRRTGRFGTGVEVVQLAFEIGTQPRPVFTLEGAQFLDSTLKSHPLSAGLSCHLRRLFLSPLNDAARFLLGLGDVGVGRALGDLQHARHLDRGIGGRNECATRRG